MKSIRSIMMQFRGINTVSHLLLIILIIGRFFQKERMINRWRQDLRIS